jgi:magnesium chelatase family protein
MLAKLNTFALVGIDAVPVEAEVDAAPGLPKTVLVGLPEMAVRESIHRVERALANLGYQRHPGRTVINLAPARMVAIRPGGCREVRHLPLLPRQQDVASPRQAATEGRSGNRPTTGLRLSLDQFPKPAQRTGTDERVLRQFNTPSR